MSTMAETIRDFSGGLHLRRSEFMIGENQSPSSLNIDMDPSAGVSTRRGWNRWNASDIVGSPTAVNWTPQHAYIHQLSSGSYRIHIADGSTVWTSGESASFVASGVTADATNHGADFAAWGDDCYIACGRSNQSHIYSGATFTPRVAAEDGTWNDDYTTPAGGVMPRADLVESHRGYLFVASVNEDYDGGGAEAYPNRLRWSHPGRPDDWAQLDYIDILERGSRITALKSFGSALLVFKEDSLWALYGYDADSWQLVRISDAVGCTSPAAVTRSPSSIFFYSAASRSGVYGISQDTAPVHISDPLEQALDEINIRDSAWVGWLNRRLWCCLPWDYELGSSGSSVFVFDPEVGDGAWTCFKPAIGELRCPIEGSDVITDVPLAVLDGSSGAAAVVQVDATDEEASDAILEGGARTAFDVRYRTGWKHLDAPHLQKSWLRPRFYMSRSAESATVRLDVYHDFDEGSPKRTQALDVGGQDTATWGSFTWNVDSWGSLVEGSDIQRTNRGRSLGWARAVSLEFSTSVDTPGVPWAMAGMTLMARSRKQTT